MNALQELTDTEALEADIEATTTFVDALVSLMQGSNLMTENSLRTFLGLARRRALYTTPAFAFSI